MVRDVAFSVKTCRLRSSDGFWYKAYAGHLVCIPRRTKHNCTHLSSTNHDAGEVLRTRREDDSTLVKVRYHGCNKEAGQCRFQSSRYMIIMPSVHGAEWKDDEWLGLSELGGKAVKRLKREQTARGAECEEREERTCCMLRLGRAPA